MPLPPGASYGFSNLSLPACHDYRHTYAGPNYDCLAHACSPTNGWVHSIDSLNRQYGGDLYDQVVTPGIRCSEGYQCVPNYIWPFLEREVMQGSCARCVNGQYCPPGTTNPQARPDKNICPAGRNCPSPSRRERCQKGYFCPMATWRGGTGCPAIIGTECMQNLRKLQDACRGSEGDEWLEWGFAGMCPEGSQAPGICGHSWEPNVGYHCPNVTTQILCPAGHFCARGANETTPCDWTWFGWMPPEERCPAGSAVDPPRPDFFIYMLLFLLPGVFICECLGKRERRQRSKRSVLVQLKDGDYGWVKAVQEIDAQAGREVERENRRAFGLGNRFLPRMNDLANTTDSRQSSNGSKRDTDGGQEFWQRFSKRNKMLKAIIGSPKSANSKRDRKYGRGVEMTSNSDRASPSDSQFRSALSAGHSLSHFSRIESSTFERQRSHQQPPPPPASPPPSPPHVPPLGLGIQHSSTPDDLKVVMLEGSPNMAEASHAAPPPPMDEPEPESGALPTGRTFLLFELSDVDFYIGKARVLKDLCCTMHEGELVGLMGESGSGKTTLLNVLGGRDDYGWRTGELTLNKRPFRAKGCGHLLGYVPQAHLVFKELTVYENLAYSAKLRLDRKVPVERRMALVETAIELLRLQDCRHFVCDPAIGERLSGGQMRRIGIGIELVCDPPILLLDEPTSALDAVNTRLVVAALKNLANRGVLVVASLHQPRHAVYQMLDKLILLRQGEMIYGGLREDSVNYFDKLGFCLPLQANPADFFIEVAFGHEASPKTLKQLVGLGFAERFPDCDEVLSGQRLVVGTGGEPDRVIQEADLVTASELGRLWRQWYGTAKKWSNRFLGFIAKRQSEDRARAVAILTFAKQQARTRRAADPAKRELNSSGSSQGSSGAAAGDISPRDRTMSIAGEHVMRNEASASKVARMHGLTGSTPASSRASSDEAALSSSTTRRSSNASQDGGESPRTSNAGLHSPRGSNAGHHHQMFTPRGSMISRAMSITGMHRHSHHQKQKKFNLVHRGDEVEFEFVVTLDAFKRWFESDAGYGTMMRPEMADLVWDRAAARAEGLKSGHRFAVSEAFAFRPRGRSFAPSKMEHTVMPTWSQLRAEMMMWNLPTGEKPLWHTTLMICFKRYFKKVLRTRVRLYFSVLITIMLGMVCGFMYGHHPPNNDLMIYFLLFNTFFGVFSSTSTVSTLGTSGNEAEFFRHEAHSGVMQTAECFARLTIDLLPQALLAPGFALPINGLSSLPILPIAQWWAFTWSLAPLGYIFTLAAPSNANVLTSGVAFVICAFTTGFFGIRWSAAPPAIRGFLDLSPGRHSFFLLAFGSATAFPRGLTRYTIMRMLRDAGLLPKPVFNPEMSSEERAELFAAAKADVASWEMMPWESWQQGAYISMFWVGIFLRLLTLVLFYCRSNINISGMKRHFNQQTLPRLMAQAREALTRKKPEEDVVLLSPAAEEQVLLSEMATRASLIRSTVSDDGGEGRKHPHPVHGLPRGMLARMSRVQKSRASEVEHERRSSAEEMSYDEIRRPSNLMSTSL